MPSTYDLETRDGIRRVEFDPDVFRSRDVRILIDGKRAAAMSYPTAASPYQEVSFQLGEHTLVAVAELSADPDPKGGLGLTYDLFAEGRSLSGGASLELTRAHPPLPGTAYPSSFRTVDMIFAITPAAAVPGLMAGVGASIDHLGWLTAIALVASLLAVMTAARGVGARTWSRVRMDVSRSVTRRAAYGALVASACYGTALAGWLVVALEMGLGRH